MIQPDIQWADPEANRTRLAGMMRGMERADVYILPEMFSTGFATEPDGIAEPMTGGTCPSLEWMKDMAAELDAAVAGSIAMEVDGCYYNRFCFVRPDGLCTFYDKHHLFTYGGEHLRYTAGTARVIAEFRGVRFLLQICYDLRFPTLRTQPCKRPLRCHHLCGQLAHCPGGGMAGSAEGACHRKPVLCVCRQPCGHGPLVPVFRRHHGHRPLRRGGCILRHG